MSQTLTGKIAVVSGSSSGIGLAIATELSSRGASVVVNYPFPSLSPEASALVKSLPTPGIAVCADLSTIEGPKELIEAVVREYGKVDILVNNAARAVMKPFEEQSLEDWDFIVNLNGRGTFLLTQAVLPYLSREGGRIVNISSGSSRDPPPLHTIYSGTKGMIDSFTRVWARELPRKYGCTVNTVSPGITETPGILGLGEDIIKSIQPAIDSTPVEARMGAPEEIAYAVGFLCEERARWMNGVYLRANGGLYIE